MFQSVITVLKASLIAGLIPAILSPITWHILLYLYYGKQSIFSIFDVFFIKILTIIYFSVIFGEIGCLLIGFPGMLVLEKLHINNIYISGFLGASVGIIPPLIIGPHTIHDFKEDWPFFIFIAFNGCVCGMAMSFLINRDRKRAKLYG